MATAHSTVILFSADIIVFFVQLFFCIFSGEGYVTEQFKKTKLCCYFPLFFQRNKLVLLFSLETIW
jgi:hypothetical protein